MLQDKQIERMVQKVARLEQMYAEFLIKEIVQPRVTTIQNGKEIEVIACSIGGGQIQIREINGLSVRFSGDYPTLIIRNQDIPGQVQQVTSFLAKENVNIGTMQLYRSARGADAVMVIECDKEVPNSLIPHLEELGGIVRVTYLSLKEENV